MTDKKILFLEKKFSKVEITWLIKHTYHFYINLYLVD
jgi:hypothetical protein